MSLATIERIIAAVELNLDRSRVTLRREDVRTLLTEHQRQLADVKHYKTVAVRLETLCSDHCADIASRQADEALAMITTRPQSDSTANLFDAAWIFPRACMLYAATAFAGFLAHG